LLACPLPIAHSTDNGHMPVLPLSPGHRAPAPPCCVAALPP
jgi:hypothetical protein